MGIDVDLATVLDPEAVADVGVAGGRAMLRFVNAAHRDGDDLAEARDDLEQEVGLGALQEVAATIAIFNGLVRVADGTGIQLDAGVLADSADFRGAAGLDEFAGAANTKTEPVAVDRSSVLDLFA